LSLQLFAGDETHHEGEATGKKACRTGMQFQLLSLLGAYCSLIMKKRKQDSAASDQQTPPLSG
jgi:hypothetical protein